jgi:hypothetical protein
MAWPRTTLLLPLAAAGCAGQNIEGAWRGPFPLAGARTCELKLQNDRSATIQCDGTAIVGGGRYHWDGSRLEIALSVLTYEGKKVPAPAPFVFKVRGEGNTLRTSYLGERYDWTRTMP